MSNRNKGRIRMYTMEHKIFRKREQETEKEGATEIERDR